eukprot:196444-Pyramimonas_sp.AAC.1
MSESDVPAARHLATELRGASRAWPDRALLADLARREHRRGAVPCRQLPANLEGFRVSQESCA